MFATLVVQFVLYVMNGVVGHSVDSLIKRYFLFYLYTLQTSLDNVQCIQNLQLQENDDDLKELGIDYILKHCWNE